MAIYYNDPNISRNFNQLKISSYGTVVSSLVKYFGESSINHVQNVADNSYTNFKKKWSRTGLPANPENEIWNNIVNTTNKLFCRKVEYLSKKNSGHKFDINDLKLPYPKNEDALRNQTELIFCIIDSKIDEKFQKYLLLNIMCGFSYSAIARIFGKSEKQVKDRLLSEKLKIINHEIYFKVQKRNFNTERLKWLKKEIKNIFNLGINNRDGMSHDICFAAVNIARAVAKYPKTEYQELNALISFMLFQLSRLDSLYDEKGNLLNLQEQNRSLWNKKMIREGFEFLHSSASGDNITRIHLEAGVSAIHSLASDYKSTDWNKIISLYDNYLAFNYDPSVELERAIAVSRLKGPEKGIDAISNIREINILKTDDLLHSTLGNLYLQMHKYQDALDNYQRAIDLTEETKEKSFYSKKIKICKQRIDMSRKYQHSLSF